MENVDWAGSIRRADQKKNKSDGEGETRNLSLAWLGVKDSKEEMVNESGRTRGEEARMHHPNMNSEKEMRRRESRG